MTTFLARRLMMNAYDIVLKGAFEDSDHEQSSYILIRLIWYYEQRLTVLLI